jgi:hypothetical protein
MRDLYPIGTLVQHYRQTERGLGIVTEYSNQPHPVMVVKWLVSGIVSYESIGFVTSIEETK